MTWFRIEKLNVKVGERQILNNFSLTIDKGELHVLLGPNGAGKTTLIKAILGFKNYIILSGKIFFKEIDITEMSTDERVKLGIGVLFQHPPKIDGVKLNKLLSVCGQKREKMFPSTNNCEDGLDEYIEDLGKRLKLNQEYLNRDVNVGFSGGEVKRSEILQMMVLKPDLLLFDEPDSGVDIENVELIAEIMRELLDRNKIPSKQEKSGLIITHLGYILKFLGHITRAHIIIEGQITCSGDPTQIIKTVMKNGFEGCKHCLSCAEDEKFKKMVNINQ